MSTCPYLTFPFLLPQFSSHLFFRSSPFPPLCEQCSDLNHTMVISSAVQCEGLISKAPWLFLEVQLCHDWCFIKPFFTVVTFQGKQAGSELSICGVHLLVPPSSLNKISLTLPICFHFFQFSPLNSPYFSFPQSFIPLFFFLSFQLSLKLLFP